MNDHPLGNVNGTEQPDAGSIVNEILDLDEFLSADVRLATRQAAFYTRPDLESEIERLNAELDSLTDSQGRPLTVVDASIADNERTAMVVAQELLEKQREYGQSRRVILMTQLDEDDWTAFYAHWKEALSKEPPYPPAFYEDLITRCAVNPRLDVDQLRQLRKRVGRPAFEELWKTAWELNTRSGVSIPKSYLSSAVLRQQQLG